MTDQPAQPAITDAELLAIEIEFKESPVVARIVGIDRMLAIITRLRQAEQQRDSFQNIANAALRGRDRIRAETVAECMKLCEIQMNMYLARKRRHDEPNAPWCEGMADGSASLYEAIEALGAKEQGT